MNILAIDTALGACSAALLVEGELVAWRYEERMRGHAERLMPMVEEVLDKARFARSDIQGIASTRGPGTFTGVRIGLSAAKGLSLALGIPLAGFTSLEVVAHNIIGREDIPEGPVCVAHDARRGEVYFQIFSYEGGLLEPQSEARAVVLERIGDDMPKEKCILIGTGVDLIRDILPEERLENIQLPNVNPQPDARILAKMAARSPERFEGERRVAPLYLRAPDAIKPKVVPLPFQESK
ncbi:tRNA (adenosine(37)-N6)-threonylcarbamoyltransferase complex dimerization subunit type 1 TsaB [Emcibacter sp.]|uniref:tRNA (adenosine(37)-N6)-threonylcarbamoyltransferase complex dimerization subunit type 1 TsaB n=1 Tax=Emcibacter sp. TaxID=1979954 RepID=UPI002AA950E4|nr:tRNA (adenosine(37)-N6)-threonylcarbamoyltransferase complex dimerization subunit type 1 TsaB [Emcibacter sp.]